VNLLEELIVTSEIEQLRMTVDRLEVENARLRDRELKSIELIRELIANAMAATFKATEAASLLNSASQSMTLASAQACLLSWELQSEHIITPAEPVAIPAPGARLSLVKSNTG